MPAPALYDLTPLATMLVVGLLLAAAPLAWVAWRHRHGTPVGRVRALTLLTLFLTFDLVLFGAFTRLTDSGLGCPDWPGCYGSASPLGAQANIQAAEAALPSGPVTVRKAWIEMLHRYLATAVGALILLVAVFTWAVGRNDAAKRKTVASNSSPPYPGTDTDSLYAMRWWALASLVWVCVQGAFGALTVTMKLFPAIVTLHLLGGVGLLMLLTVQAAGPRGAGEPAVTLVSPATRALLWLGFATLLTQIALGGWVSTNYAVLACSDFPRCQGSFWPVMNFTQGFELWRHLGVTGAGETISFSALTAIHFTHRAFALVVVAVLAALAWRLNGVLPGPATRASPLRTPARFLAALLGLQVATGLANVVLGWPLLAAVLHTGGAAALAVVLTWVACTTRAAPPVAHTQSSPQTGKPTGKTGDKLGLTA